MMRVPRAVHHHNGPMVIVDRGDGNLSKTRDPKTFLARNPRGFVVGSAGSQGAAEPAATSALNKLTTARLRQLAEEQDIEVPSGGRKAGVIAALEKGGFKLPDDELEDDAEDEDEDDDDEEEEEEEDKED